jgi:putative hydroxymethylpyrimidine transport system substrate-binding protein
MKHKTHTVAILVLVLAGLALPAAPVSASSVTTPQSSAGSAAGPSARSGTDSPPSERAAPAVEKLTLMLDWFPNIDHLPVYLARELGLFARSGLEVEIAAPSDTTDALKLAAAGTVDLAVSYEPQTLIAAAGGLEVRAVGTLVGHPLTTLLFLKGRGISRPGDLEGGTIGYTVPGLMDLLLQAFARVNGIREYRAVNVGFTILPALVTGRADAVMGPFKTYETVAMAREGYEAGYFELEKHGIPEYEELIFVCSPGVLARKRDAVRRFVRAVEEGISRARENPEEALAIYLKAVPEADPAMEREAFTLTLPHYGRPGGSDAAAWQAFADFALEHGLIDRRVDAGALIHTW